jgi:hypothetical protein
MCQFSTCDNQFDEDEDDHLWIQNTEENDYVEEDSVSDVDD